MRERDVGPGREQRIRRVEDSGRGAAAGDWHAAAVRGPSERDLTLLAHWFRARRRATSTKAGAWPSPGRSPPDAPTGSDLRAVFATRDGADGVNNWSNRSVAWRRAEVRTRRRLARSSLAVQGDSYGRSERCRRSRRRCASFDGGAAPSTTSATLTAL